MAKFKTSINLYDAVNRLASLSRPNQTGDFFVVVDSFDFGRDVNGNTINKYRATLHRGDLASVQNGYTGFGVLVLESPHRREQSHNEGQSAALYWLEKMGYDLAYESMTDHGGNVYSSKKDLRRYRHVYRVTNTYLKAL